MNETEGKCLFDMKCDRFWSIPYVTTSSYFEKPGIGINDLFIWNKIK